MMHMRLGVLFLSISLLSGNPTWAEVASKSSHTSKEMFQKEALQAGLIQGFNTFKLAATLHRREGSILMVAGGLVAAVLIPGTINAQDVPPRVEQALPFPAFNGWLPYFSPQASRSALENFGNHFNELSIFAIRASGNGGLEPAHPYVLEALQAARALTPRPRILLTITNDSARRAKVSAIVSQWISRPERRAKHIAELLGWAEQADGLDIDYENLRHGDAPHFTIFIQELASALHARGKYLSVTLEPKTSDTARPIDWRAIGQYADRVRVMAYQYHGPTTSPGLISPLADVLHLAAYALETIPQEKVEIALATYGFDWPTRGKARLIGSQAQFDEMAQQAGAEMWLDPDSNAGRISYLAGKGKRKSRREIWMEVPESLAQKIKALQNLGIFNIGVWQVTSGDMEKVFRLTEPLPVALPPLPPLPEIPLSPPSIARRAA